MVTSGADANLIDGRVHDKLVVLRVAMLGSLVILQITRPTEDTEEGERATGGVVNEGLVEKRPFLEATASRFGDVGEAGRYSSERGSERTDENSE